MEEMSTVYPFTSTGFFVSQPFGEFIVTSIPARILLETAYSDRLRAEKQPDGSYKLSGSQRDLAEPRLRLIGKFIDNPTAAFPNTIILAANYRENDGLIEQDHGDEDLTSEKKQWSFDENTKQLIIPSPARLAAIIDGQHRLFGFNYIQKPERLDFPLLCVVYFDLPQPYQAFLFATVNSNQRPVNKSQTYELFGYNIEDEPPDKWTPEKLAVFLTRKLNVEADSPFRCHIFIPAENDFSPTIGEIRRTGDWAVSMAAVVEGIVMLISSNPKQDSYEMHGTLDYKGGSRSILASKSLGAVPPLRKLYLSTNDELIYTGIKNFFIAVNGLFWANATAPSLIRKAAGIQALFDVARSILKEAADEKDFSVSYFQTKLQTASNIDFLDSFFQTSGSGKGRIRNTIELLLKRRDYEAIPAKDFENYRRLADDLDSVSRLHKKLLYLIGKINRDVNVDYFIFLTKAVPEPGDSEAKTKLLTEIDPYLSCNKLFKKYAEYLTDYKDPDAA
jgi:DNA phosphorothioation-associated DGQHR protein 1